MCPPGTFSSQTTELTWACDICPEQYHCPMRGDNKLLANVGYFSPLGVHLPLVVPAGYAAGNGVPIAPCKPGYHSDDFAGVCTQCKIGEVCTFTSNRPLPCNEGMETSTAGVMSAGRFTCVPCLINEIFNPATQRCEATTAGYGSIHSMLDPEKCIYGEYSDATSIADANRLDCKDCTDGYTCGSASTSATQTACPAGYWCSAADEQKGRISKYPCPAGYKASGAAAASRTTMAAACTICTAGSYCEGADHPETDCIAGFFCPTGTKYATQYPCPAATISVARATAIGQCTACTAGKFCPGGTGTERNCPPGSACNDLQIDRYSDLCPTGQYFSGSACVACLADHYCPPGTHFPLKCPAGTKGDTSIAGGLRDRIEHCVACNAGDLCPRYGQNGPKADYTLEAGLGYYSTRGTEFKHQLACPAGFYTTG